MERVRDLQNTSGVLPFGSPTAIKFVPDKFSRTLDELLTHTPLAGERLQPLGQLSEFIFWHLLDLFTRFKWRSQWEAPCSGLPALHPKGSASRGKNDPVIFVSRSANSPNSFSGIY